MSLKKNIIEETPEYVAVVKEVDDMVYKILSNQNLPLTIGYVHRAWPLKKKILKEKYNIDWKTPQEMNPDIIFD